MGSTGLQLALARSHSRSEEKLKMAEICSNLPFPSSEIDVPRTKEIEEDFSWLLVFSSDHHRCHSRRCSLSRRASESSSSSSGVASCNGVSSSESCTPLSTESCSGDSGCCGVVATSSSSSMSSSECSSTSDCNATIDSTSDYQESLGDYQESLGESTTRHAEEVVSHPPGLNPYAAPFDPQQSFNRHLERLKKRSCDEESWGDEDVESHGDAFVSGEFQQEEKKATPPDGSSTEEAVKGRKGRSSYRLVMSFNSLPYFGKSSVRK